MSEQLNVNDFNANQGSIDKLTSKDATIEKLTSKEASIDKLKSSVIDVTTLTAEFLKLKKQIELLNTELKVVKDSTELINISQEKTEIKNDLYVNKELVSVPIGTIVAFYGTIIPDGWALCNGTNGTPDLRNKFIRGSENVKIDSSTYSKDEVILTVENLPDHNHVYYESWFNASTKYGTRGLDNNDSLYSSHQYDFKARLTKSISDDKKLSSSALKSKAFSIVPKHIRIAYIMKIK